MAMALLSGASAQPQQAYSNKVLEGETVVSGGEHCDSAAYADSMHVFVVR